MTQTITALDKSTCRTIAAAAETKLNELAAELGLTVKIGGGKYDPVAGTFTPKITFGVPGLVDVGFERDATLIGLEGVSLGTEFTSPMGARYAITGINLRAQKYPITAESVRDGKSYKFPAAIVRNALAQEGSS